MAADNDLKRIIDERIHSIKDLREAIKEYKDAMANAKEGTEDWKKAADSLGYAQDKMNKINKAAKGTLDGFNKSEKDSINVLKEKIKQLNLERNAMDMNSKEYKEATKELKVLNDRLREAGTSAGDWRANVGNYTQSITQAFGQLGSAAGGLTGPLGAVNASMLKLATNPVGAVVIAIVAAIKLLAEGIKSSEENTNKFNQVLAPLKGILAVIMQDIQKLTGKVLDFVHGLQQNEKFVNILKGALQGIVAVFNICKERIEAIWDVVTDVWDGIKEIGAKIGQALQPVFNVIGRISSEIFKKIKPAIDFIVNAWNKIAATKLGKALGFNMLSIKSWGEAWEEAGEQVDTFTDRVQRETKTQQKSNEIEARLLQQKRDLMIQNANIAGEIAQLDLEIAELQNEEVKDYDRILELMDERNAKEKQRLQNELQLRQAELAVIQLRNSMSDSNTKDLDAEAQAQAAVIEATNALTLADANNAKQKKKILAQKYAQQDKQEAEAYKKAVNELNLALKELDLQYQQTMEAMAKPMEAPEGAAIDSNSIDEYYDSVVAAYNAEYQAYATMTDAKIAKLQEFIDTQKALGKDTAAQELEISRLRQEKDKQYNKMMDATAKANKQRAKDQKANFNATLNAYGSMLDGMAKLFKENTIAYKVTATAKALIDTFLAANAVLAEQQGGVIARTAAMAAVLAEGIANVVSIWSVSPTGENSTPSAGATSAVAQIPQVIDSTPYSYSRNLQTEEEEEKLNQPIYVSVTDINNVQNKVKVVEEESTW